MERDRRRDRGKGVGERMRERFNKFMGVHVYSQID
jgi:hypothetical protein